MTGGADASVMIFYELAIDGRNPVNHRIYIDIHIISYYEVHVANNGINMDKLLINCRVF